MQENKIEQFASVAAKIFELGESYAYHQLVITYVKEKYPEVFKESDIYAQERIYPDHNPLADLLEEEAV
tara:strand:- start:96 stop:302 length:207 start_codon:yes stop_codon:yes gene_type:complete